MSIHIHSSSRPVRKTKMSPSGRLRWIFMTSMRFQGGKDIKNPTGLTTSGGKKIESLTTVGWWKMQASYSCSFLMQKILKGLRKKFDYIWLYNSSTTLDELKTTHKHSAKQKKHPSNQTTFTADST